VNGHRSEQVLPWCEGHPVQTKKNERGESGVWFLQTCPSIVHDGASDPEDGGSRVLTNFVA